MLNLIYPTIRENKIEISNNNYSISTLRDNEENILNFNWCYNDERGEIYDKTITIDNNLFSIIVCNKLYFITKENNHSILLDINIDNNISINNINITIINSNININNVIFINRDNDILLKTNNIMVKNNGFFLTYHMQDNKLVIEQYLKYYKKKLTYYYIDSIVNTAISIIFNDYSKYYKATYNNKIVIIRHSQLTILENNRIITNQSLNLQRDIISQLIDLKY